MNRREFLMATTVTPATLFLSRQAIATSQSRQELPIPELYEGEHKNGKLQFRLNVEHGEVEFFKGYKTATLGYNGNYLGPTMKMKKRDFLFMNISHL